MTLMLLDTESRAWLEALRDDRYVELEPAGEQPDRIVPGMEAHLRGCPACKEEYESLRDLLPDDYRYEVPDRRGRDDGRRRR